MAITVGSRKVGLVPVTLMVSGNIMGSGVFLLPANLAATGGIAIYGWIVTITGALALSIVYAKMSSIDDSAGGSYAYARRAFGPFIGYQTNLLYWLACWIGNIAMVVIGVGYLSYFFPILKEPMVLTLTCIAVLWLFVILNIIGPKMITRVQGVATVLALIPILAIAIFGKVNKNGVPAAGLLILGVLMTLFQITAISPNATAQFALVSSVSVIFTLVPYLYTCAALLLVGHGHLGSQLKMYSAITLIAFVYCIWAGWARGRKRSCGHLSP